MNSVVPGAELTKEPFRWDQRIFSLVMRLPASVPPDVSAFPFIPSAENTAIDVMCEVTGGTCVVHISVSVVKQVVLALSAFHFIFLYLVIRDLNCFGINYQLFLFIELSKSLVSR